MSELNHTEEAKAEALFNIGFVYRNTDPKLRQEAREAYIRYMYDMTYHEWEIQGWMEEVLGRLEG